MRKLAPGEKIERLTKPAPLDTDWHGNKWTGKLRIRSTWFFGLTVVEELVERSDGRSEWLRAPFPVALYRSAA
jgi:hypothetical protein